jgi:hypothetical protein
MAPEEMLAYLYRREKAREQSTIWIWILAILLAAGGVILAGVAALGRA